MAEIILEDFQQLQNQIAETTEEMGTQLQAESKFIPQTINIPTQTEREALQNMATQTQQQKQARKKKQVQLDIEAQLNSDPVDEVVITNTVCPPPLFFNSECEPDYIKPVKEYFQMQDAASHQANVDDASDDDTIRVEDLSDDDLQLDLPSEQLFSRKKEKLKPFIPPSTVQSLTRDPLDMKQYPMLNALMTEITRITSETRTQTKKQADIQIHKPRAGGSLSPRTKRAAVKSPRRARPTSPVRERTSIENFVRRMHSPKASLRELPIVKPTYDTTHEPQPRRPLHSNKCKHPPAGVPKTKSWLRATEVPLEVRKTKLAYGLTNSMKLRLEKSNPQLLRSLERKEEDRVRKFKAQRQEEERAAATAAGTTRKLYDGTARRGRVLQFVDQTPRPVPTPRHSLHDSLPHAHSKTTDPHITTMQQVREHYRSQYNATPDIDVRPEDARSDHSNESEPEPVTADDSLQLRKVNNNPGFPSSAKSSARGDPDSYEDDFDDVTERSASRVASSTVHGFPLRNESASKTSKVSSEDDIRVQEALDPGELLGLRRMTDVYSDVTDDEQQDGGDADSFRTARSGSDEIEVKPYQPEPTQTSLGAAHAASRAGFDNKWKQPVDASVDSTAYISRSQVFPNQSVESEVSTDTRRSRPEPKARPALRRRNTDSISSYVGEDNDSKLDSAMTHDSDDSISDVVVPSALSMKDMAISKEAKLGYTWAHS